MEAPQRLLLHEVEPGHLLEPAEQLGHVLPAPRLQGVPRLVQEIAQKLVLGVHLGGAHGSWQLLGAASLATAEV